MSTKFMMRDERKDETKYREVTRKLYKAAARNCSEDGVPIRTSVSYFNGRPIKYLSILNPKLQEKKLLKGVMSNG